MQGKRVDVNIDLGHELPRLLEGDFGKDIHGNWFVRCPKDPHGCGIQITGHEGQKDWKVVEHEDGMITVSPSILLYDDYQAKTISYHGMLEHGVWREC